MPPFRHADGLAERVRAIGGEIHRRLGAVVPGVEGGAVRLEAHGIDAPVGTLTAGQGAKRVRHVDFHVVEDLGLALRRSHREPLRKAVDGNDALGAEQICALDGELTDGTAAPDGHRIARLDLAVLRGHVAGWKNVGEEQHLFIGEGFGHLDRPDVGERHANVLRLPAGVSAVHVRIAEEPRPEKPQSFSAIQAFGLSCRRATTSFLAEVAVPAGDGERHHDAIADLERVLLLPTSTTSPMNS